MRKCLLLAVLGTSALNVAKAEEYPYRYPSYYRTVFIEAATKACVRDEGDNPTKTVLTFCECKVAGVAAFLTAKDLAEMLEGGVHVTPRYQALADQFESECQKVVTGR
jgi:hypothetical protein